MREILQRLEELPRGAVTAFGLALIVALGVLDYATGRELSVWGGYLLPVSVCTWAAGRRSGTLNALAGAVVVFVADMLPGAAYAQPWIPYWNALMVLVTFLIVVHLLTALKDVHTQLEQRVRQRTAALLAEVAERQRAEQELTLSNAELSRSKEELEQALAELQEGNRELRATQLQLIESVKMESVGRLAAGVAHEVKNPLAIIQAGIAHLRAQPFAGATEVAITLQDIEEAVDRGDAVVSGLLDFSAPSELEIELAELNPLLEKSLLLVKHDLARSRVTVVRAFDDRNPRLWIDGNKIEQVLVNILTNAIQAMTEGGRLTVRTRIEEFSGPDRTNLAGGRKEPLLRVGHPVVVVEVEDNGPGVREQQLDRIFDPFYTTKPNERGTGLGLTVSRRIVELHGGTLRAANLPGAGLQVAIRIPM